MGILPPDLSGDSFGGQHLHSPRVYLHHVHDRITEDDTSQFLVACDLSFHVICKVRVAVRILS